MIERPLYNRSLKVLEAAHNACFKANDEALGMSNGPFSGVNEVLGIVDTLERENLELWAELEKRGFKPEPERYSRYRLRDRV